MATSWGWGRARSYAQNIATGQKMRVSYEDGQYIVYGWVPTKESESREESENIFDRQPLGDVGCGE